MTMTGGPGTNPCGLKTAHLAKHAQHVAVIHSPIALLMAGAFFDLLARKGRDRSLSTVAESSDSFPAGKFAAWLVAQLEWDKTSTTKTVLHCHRTYRGGRGWRRDSFCLCGPERIGLGGARGLGWRFYFLYDASMNGINRLE